MGTNFSYSDNYYNDNGANPPSSTAAPGATNAYLTSVQMPIIGTQYSGYYYGSGKKAYDQDQNSAKAYYHFTDSLDRPTTAIAPDGGWSMTVYSSATVTDGYSGINDVTPSSTCSSCVHNQTTVDGLGRVTQTALLSDPSGATYKASSYDLTSRVSSTTNPYRSTSDPTYGSSTMQYDGLDRVLTKTKADGNVYQNMFGAAISSVTQFCSTSTYGVGYPSVGIDPTNKKRQYWTDGFGKIIEVDEPNSNNVLNVATCYKYDALGNLTQVIQQSEMRTYAYDGLARVTSKTEPESGTTTYSYTAGSGLCSGNPGNVCSQTDARGTTITYAYDALGRVTTKSFSDGTPQLGFEYDQSSLWGISLSNTKGRVSHQYTGSGERVFSYDKAGRAVDQWECLPSNCGVSSYHTNAVYNLAGQVKQLTYPSGRQVTYTYGNAGRATQVAMTAGGGQSMNYLYASSVAYAPTGAVSSVNIGNSNTPLAETYTYNNRLQLATAVVSSSVITAMNHSYGVVDGSGHNDGDVISISDQLNSSRTQTFTYDNLDRISTATETNWGLSYSYDAYGSMLQQNVTRGSAPTLNVSVNTKNQMVGFGYDNAGNLTADGTNTYQYDALNRLKALNTTGATYSYDVGNQRIIKQVGSDTAEYVIFGGQNIAYHHSANWNDWTDLIYLNGKLLAKSDTFEDRIHTHGTNCSNCGSQYSLFTFGGLKGYVIRSGDKLFLRQYQGTGAHGGMSIGFTDNTDSHTATDQDGNGTTNDQPQNTWHYRRIDMSSFAGKTVSAVNLVTETTTAAGAWDIYYQDIALVSTDGTVQQLYNRQTSISLTVFATTGVTGAAYEVNHASSEVATPDVTTQFYHADHLGSSRMMSSVNGYPVWQGSYLPFGYEYNPQITTNLYKFTGYEHDSESGLEYANQRHFASQYARFMSVDPVGAKISDPQTLNRYSYTRNNPLKFIDPSGSEFVGTLLGEEDDMSADWGDGGGGGGGGDGCCVDLSSDPSASLGDGGTPIYDLGTFTIATTVGSGGTAVGDSTYAVNGTVYDSNTGQSLGPQISPGAQAVGTSVWLQAGGLTTPQFWADFTISSVAAVGTLPISAGAEAASGFTSYFIDSLGTSLSPGQAVFWSGAANGVSATNFALETGGTTLGMTPAGQALEAAEAAGMNWGAGGQAAWQSLSGMYANTAAEVGGDVHAFVSGATENGIWTTVEKPILQSSPNVTVIPH